MAQSSTLQPPAAEVRQTPKSADYSVLRARIDLAGGGHEAPSGEGDVRGRRRLISLLREKKKKRSSADSAAGDASSAQAQTTAQTETPEQKATRGDLLSQTTGALFRPSEPNEGLGGEAALQADGDASGKEGQKKSQKSQELLLLAPGTRASASASGNRRARQLMVAPKAPVRRNQSAKQNGKHNGAGSRPGRGYESSSDDEGGRSSLGRKKVRKG